MDLDILQRELVAQLLVALPLSEPDAQRRAAAILSSLQRRMSSDPDLAAAVLEWLGDK